MSVPDPPPPPPQDDVDKFNKHADENGLIKLKNIFIDVDLKKTLTEHTQANGLCPIYKKEIHVEKYILGKLITDGYKAQGPEYIRAFEESQEFKKNVICLIY